jgi:hypothetical protein
MRDKDLILYVRASPFKPFRVVMNSGRTFEIRHPEFVDVGRSVLTISYAESEDEAPNRFVTVSLLLIERVETIEPPPANLPAE